MGALTTLAQSLGLAYAAGINPYATVALLGIADRLGWVSPLPGALSPISNPLIIGLAGTLAVIEFLTTLIPGLASLWETVHTAIRPPAAAALAVLTAWQGDAALILVAGLLGGSLGLATHATKLGLRYTIDTSPEPVSNAVMNIAELGVIATLSYAIWNHPYLTITAAIALLVTLVLAVRLVWRTMRRTFATVFHTAPPAK